MFTAHVINALKFIMYPQLYILVTLTSNDGYHMCKQIIIVHSALYIGYIDIWRWLSHVQTDYYCTLSFTYWWHWHLTMVITCANRLLLYTQLYILVTLTSDDGYHMYKQIMITQMWIVSHKSYLHFVFFKVLLFDYDWFHFWLWLWLK